MDFGLSAGFVEQQDAHDGTATVQGAPRFSAMLRQQPSTPRAEKYALVEPIIGLLALEGPVDALIGERVGLKAEERKSVTIGVGPTAMPESLLFSDEPRYAATILLSFFPSFLPSFCYSSGLDSPSTLSTIHFLKKN